MCGIIGLASRHPVERRDWVATGRDLMRHRGPDDAGEWWSADGRVGLGFRRLSILDLSPAGHQPMLDATGRLCLVFNGEIYNFADLRDELMEAGATFRSRGDTEVLLAAYRHWGTECLAKLNGMFAFALYDGDRRQLLLARDRAGEKPLFYAETDGAVRFASELKGLMADSSLPRRINLHALDSYLFEGYVPGERCILEGVQKLPAAHALLFDLCTGRSRRWRYWRLPESNVPAPACAADESQLLEELETLLEDAVRRQLVADVPVGVLLSGGVDSSLVTAMAVRAASGVKTFTVRFPGYEKYDETEHARLIARHFGTEHVELEAGATTVDMLPLLARQYDEPIIDSSMIPTYLLSGLIRQHCTVALGGDGGDELFGGYSHYNRLLWLQQKFGWMPGPARQAAARASDRLPVGLKGRNWLQALAVDFDRTVPLIATYFDLGTRRQLMAGRPHWELVSEQMRDRRCPDAGDLLERATRLDFEAYLADDILVKVDRASMLNSLEVRVPMLDVRVIEFAFGKLSSSLKASAVARKVFLKRLCTRVLPPDFDQRRKQGFNIPLASWLQSGPWQVYFREVLLDDEQTLFDHDVIERLFEGQRRGRFNSERLFGLVMFELWRREYDVDVTVAG